jgi:hypothetical protein
VHYHAKTKETGDSVSLSTHRSWYALPLYRRIFLSELTVNPAKLLKKKWVETRKIKSKWKSVKRKAAQSVENDGRAEGGRADDERADDGLADERRHASGQSDDESSSSESSDEKPEAMTREPAQSTLRELSKEAYKQNRSGCRGPKQPNMKLRMNVLLEKIKRDFT